MEKAKQEQKELTKKIGEENSKALKEDYDNIVNASDGAASDNNIKTDEQSEK